MPAMADTVPLRMLGQLLLVVGLLIAAAGLLLLVADKLPGSWRLPGDIVVQRGRWTIFFPITTMLVISILLTLVLNVLFRK